MQTTIFKGIELSREDVLHAMRIFDEERRKAFTHWRDYAVEYDGKCYPPKEILRIAAGRDVGRFSGGESTNRHFRELGFKVVEIEGGETLTDEVVDEAIDASLSLEKDLERILVADLSQLEPGLRLYGEKGLTGRQVDTGAVGRIDILALDANENFVVIELKAGEANDRVCGQILRYMGWVKENIASGCNVRGIIVASDFDEGLRFAASITAQILLKKYEVNFRFTDVSPGGGWRMSPA